LGPVKSFGALFSVALALVILPSAASASGPETVLLGGPGALTSSSTATFSFEAGGHSGSPDNASFQCRLDSTGDWEPCSSPVTYTELADGPHRFEVRAKTAWHRWDHWHHWWSWCYSVDLTPVVVEFTVDTTAPRVEIEAAPTGTIDVGEVTIAFSAEEAGGGEVAPTGVTSNRAAADEAGPEEGGEEVAAEAEKTTFECRLDSSAPAAWLPCSSPATFSGLADGPHRIEVGATDAAGNVDPTPAVVAFAVDTAPPDTTVDTAPSAKIDVREATITFSSPEGTVFQCRLDPQPGSPWEPCDGSVTLAGLSEGSHTFEVRAGDSFGRFDPTPAQVTFFVDIPVNGARLAAMPLAGTVKIKTPGTAKFRPLTEGETIPVDSVVDTTAGKVSLTSVDQYGEEQRASFFKGTFRVEQQPGQRLVNLQLRGGNVDQCGSEEEGEARASAASPGSALWGSGKGHFRTQGNFGSATVRGTIWLTEDTCEGTFFKVNRGIVSVRDFPRHKNVLVPAGHTYLARNPAG
jgi:hypothetical protein